jgi:glycerol-3-phosphate acyltransferase PlsX
LKTCEGLVKLIFRELRASIKRGGLLVKLGALLSRPAFGLLQKTLNADEYGGAILLGVNGNFIIAHGSANQVAIKNAIHLGARCARGQLVLKLNQKIKQYREVAS